jgi:molybdenum cofactor cytidylyltransferase
MATLCGLILAAGASSRMGTEKALLPWPPASPGAVPSGTATLLSSAILALQPFTHAVVVVTGKNAGNLAPVIASCGARMVLNPDPDRGQFSSLQTGLREVLARGCDAAMITPVDCPPLSAATLHLLRDQFEDALARGLWAVAPENSGRHGHPLIAGRSLIDAFLAAPPTGNARQIRRAHARFLEYVAVPDLLLSADMNTPEEYAAASARTQQLEP